MWSDACKPQRFRQRESTCHGREIPVCLCTCVCTPSLTAIIQIQPINLWTQFANICLHLSKWDTHLRPVLSIASKPPKLPAHMNESYRMSSRNLSTYWPTFLRQSDGDAVKYFQEGSSGFICHCFVGPIIWFLFHSSFFLIFKIIFSGLIHLGSLLENHAKPNQS